METKSVIAALNAMALANVDPSNTTQQEKISQRKVLSCAPLRQLFYLITCPCGKQIGLNTV
jgi:hypothetical protein